MPRFTWSKGTTILTDPIISDQREQVTLGITAHPILESIPYQIGLTTSMLGSDIPDGAAAIKGSFVQRLKSYVI